MLSLGEQHSLTNGPMLIEKIRGIVDGVTTLELDNGISKVLKSFMYSIHARKLTTPVTRMVL